METARPGFLHPAIIASITRNFSVAPPGVIVMISGVCWLKYCSNVLAVGAVETHHRHAVASVVETLQAWAREARCG